MHLKTILRSSLLLVAALPALSQEKTNSSLPAPSVAKATDAIFSAFGQHAVVGLGDVHGMAQEEDFYLSLIQDPRFAAEVGNVVVEFGDASQQNTIDRYVNGDEVPYTQLRKVWADTVGWLPTVTSMGYLNFYAQVRAVNSALPKERRIRVWLGDPPIDWSKPISQADFSKILADRDRYPADLLETEIFAKGKKALVLYGTFHFYFQGSLRNRIEAHHPGAFFIVTPYSGFTDLKCSEAFEKTVQNVPAPFMVGPVRKTQLQQLMKAPGCHFLNASDFSFPVSFTKERKAKELSDMEDQSSGVAGDALIYLGAARTLTESPLSPDLYLDEDFRKELNKRSVLKGEGPLTWPSVADNPASPKFVRPYGGLLGEQR